MGFFGGGGAAPANMGGATSSAAGTAGLVPAPAAGQEHLFLTGGGRFTWLFPPTTNFNTSTRYQGPMLPISFGGVGTSNLVTEKLQLCLIYISGLKEFNRIGFRFTGAAGCGAIVGLYYASPTELIPTTNIVTSTKLTGSTNTTVEYTISPSITLKQGIYWGAMSIETDTSMSAMGYYSNAIDSLFGLSYDSSLNAYQNKLYVDYEYSGSLPSDLSSYTLKADGGNSPVVHLRKA